MDVNRMVDQFGHWYASAATGTCPSPDQWTRILARDPDRPFALMNFFKLREIARYEPDQDDGVPVSGEEAFARYSAISIPTMDRVGGSFLLVGSFQGSFVGGDENWDLIAVGRYPNLEAFQGLYGDEAYQSVFHHRTAACERQKVLICDQ